MQIHIIQTRERCSVYNFCRGYVLTNTTASLAANAKISAQDTTPGHIASTALFAPSIT